MNSNSLEKDLKANPTVSEGSGETFYPDRPESIWLPLGTVRERWRPRSRTGLKRFGPKRRLKQNAVATAPVLFRIPPGVFLVKASDPHKDLIILIV